jgi:hypothetical protein
MEFSSIDPTGRVLTEDLNREPVDELTDHYLQHEAAFTTNDDQSRWKSRRMYETNLELDQVHSR